MCVVPWKLGMPTERGAVLSEDRYVPFSLWICKTSFIDSTSWISRYIGKNAWRGFPQHFKEITLSQMQEGEISDSPSTTCTQPCFLPHLAQLQQTSFSPCQACPLPVDFPWYHRKPKARVETVWTTLCQVFLDYLVHAKPRHTLAEVCHSLMAEFWG